MRGIHVQIDARPALFRLANGARRLREGGTPDEGDALAPRVAGELVGEVVAAADRFHRVRDDHRRN